MLATNTRVAVVDGHAIAREGLVSLLSREGFDVVGSFGSAERLLIGLEDLDPTVVVLEQQLAGLNGATACRELLARRPSLSVVILTEIDHEHVIHACIACGARGYLLKSAPATDIVDGLRRAARGEPCLSPAVMATIIGWARRARSVHEDDSAISPHEFLTLSLASRGLTIREIARKLSVSESSTKTYLRAVILKLGVKDRAEAIAAAIRLGVI